MSTIRQDIQQREYFFHYGATTSNQPDRKVWQAPNRKQNIRIYADENGMEILERAGERKRLLQLRTVAFGRGKLLKSIESGRIIVHENRLEIQRDALTEWYINSEAGIEQGFTLSRRIAGQGELSIVLNCTKRPVLIDETHLVLHSETGRLLDYGKLLVTDATGKNIPSRFTLLADNRFSISLDDRTAIYPLTIDPIISSTADTLLAGDQVNGYFGTTVANAGDINGDGFDDVAVGVPDYDRYASGTGALFVYLGSSQGVHQSPSIQLYDGGPNEHFGKSVAGAGDIDGNGYDDFVVGSDQENPSTPGKIIVFFSDPNITMFGHDRIFSGTQNGDRFGRSVAAAGDVNGDGYADVVVGAPFFDRDSHADEGRAYVYYGSADGNLSDSDEFAYRDTGQIIFSHPDEHFGSTVAGGGDINGDGYADILVATSRDDSGTTNEVYIYYGSAGGISTQQDSSARLESPQADSDFGKGLTMAGDLNGDGFDDLVIGAPDYDADGLTNQGAIFVHFGSSTGLSTTLTSLAFKSNSNGARLGTSVSGGGDINGDGYSDIVVGASGYSIGNGAVYIYHGHAGGLNYSSTVQLTYIGIALGADVDITGDVNGDGYADLIAGAPLLGVNQISHCGAVFVFHGSADLMDNTPDFFLESNKSDADFGASVSGAGDFNGDGYDDIIVGAPFYDKGQGKSGMAFLYYGPPGGLLWPFPLQLGSDVPNQFFGENVAAAGDVNGDGYGDVIIGAPTSPFDGKAFIYYGDAFLNFPPKSFLSAGDVVAGAGDINGDGYGDVMVADPDFDEHRGRISIYLGSAHGIKTTPSTRIVGTRHIGFGRSIAGIGDVNGDGYSDIAVGARDYENGESGEGAVFIYHGSAHGVSATSDAVLEGNYINAGLGPVSHAGDVNGDGFDDVIAGADGRGRGYLYLGSTGGLASSSPALLQGNGVDFGYSVSGAGDVNGDGLDDILIGSQLNSATLFFGNPTAVDTGSPVVFQSPQNNSQFGYSLSGAGDVNGDGFADIIIGARKYDHGQQDEGAAFLYLGNSNGRPVRTSFLRKDGSHPVASRGASYDNSGFQLRMDLHSPRGKEKIRIEALVCPEIQPPPGVFNTCDTFLSPWQDAMANYSFSLTGLDPGLYFVQTRLAYAPYAAVTQGIYQPAHLCAGNFPCPASRHTPWRYLHGDRATSVIRIGMPKNKKFPWPMFLPGIINGQK